MTRGAVVVTGAGSGIGQACALRLHDHGFRVFAGVRKRGDLEAVATWRPGLRLVPVLLDVTDSHGIGEARSTVEGALEGDALIGVVNSAGISGGGPLELLASEDVSAVMQTNFLGTVAVIQAFLPLLRSGRGRVVCIGSIGGRVPTPFLAPYSASKAAVAALCDCLRVELRPWGIQVILVEPGSIATPMWSKGLDKFGNLMTDEHAMHLYGDAMKAVRAAGERAARAAVPPSTVAAAVERALTRRWPKPASLVGPDARLQASLTLLPRRARDLAFVLYLRLPSRRS